MKKRETKRFSEKLPLIVWGAFAGVILLTCYLLFLFNYSTAYKGGDYISGRMMVFLYHLPICAAALLTAVILKLALKKKIRLGSLLSVAVILPLLCFFLNYHTLKKDGLFYSVVDEGGIFHFIAIGDFDFDGMNDEEHHRLYEERVYATSYTDLRTDEIKRIDTKATGIGVGLNGCYAGYDGEARTVTLHLNKKGVELKEIKLEFFLAAPVLGDSFSLYLTTDSGEVPVEHTLSEDGTIFVVFDADTCSDWQRNSDNEFIRVVFRYMFEAR